MLTVGPPGAGKSMLAARLPSILPPLPPAELLEVSMIASVASEIVRGALTNRRRFAAPITLPACRLSAAAGCGQSRARFRLPITACCSLPNYRSSTALCS
jgi:predicted ATPase with chaperone activity